MFKLNKNKFANKKPVNFRRVLYGAIAFISIIVVFSTIQTSTIGSKLQFLEEKEKGLEEETRVMEEELVNSDSLSKISDEADKYQFTKPQKIVYSKETVEVGLNLH